nr:MAG TPA: hypothetical protein [Crassvirales sp.]
MINNQAIKRLSESQKPSKYKAMLAQAYLANR